MKNKNLGDLIKEISKPLSRENSFLAVVREFEDERICIVESCDSINFDLNKPNKDNYIYDVRIAVQADENISTAFYLKPKINSYVMVSRYNQEQKFITMFSKVDKIILTVEKDGVIILGDVNNSNMIKINNDDKINVESKDRINLTCYDDQQVIKSKIGVDKDQGDMLFSTKKIGLYTGNDINDDVNNIQYFMMVEKDNPTEKFAGLKAYNIYLNSKYGSTIESDGAIELNGVNGVSIKGNNLFLYDTLEKLILTITTNVVPACAVVGTGATLAADLTQILIELKLILNNL